MIGYLLQGINAYNNKDYKASVIPASLFFQSDEVGFISDKDETDFKSLPFDLLVNESHTLEFKISDHAVENGVTISDHVQPRLRSVDITGIFTCHSINKNFYVDNGKVKESDSVELVDVKKSSKSITNTAIERFEQLQKLAQKRAKVRLVTYLEVYDEMIIERISASRGADDGEAIKFTCTLRQIKTAQIESRTLNAVWEPPEPQKMDKPEKKAMSKKKTKGKQSGQQIDPKEIAKKLEELKRQKVF